MADDRWKFSPDPDARAVAFLEGKGLQRSWRWASMWQEQHAYGFTLAGVHRLDVLAAAKQLVTEAVARGETLEQFRSRFEERLNTLGFAGPQTVTDFAEGPRQVNLSAPARVKVIYDTNVRQAYGAAEWQAIQATADDFPALQYHHTPQAHPRQEHLAWDGIVVLVADPFWRTHYPQNGWFCKCFTTQVSVQELADGSVKLTTAAQLAATGYDPDPAHWPEWRNKQTGRTERVPEGITPGFAYNAGLERRANLAQLLQRRVEALDPDMARAAAADLVNLPLFNDLAIDAVNLGQARAAARLEAAARVRGGGGGKGEADAAGAAAADAAGSFASESWPVGVIPADLAGDQAVVVANASAIGHSADMHPTTPADWRRVQLMLEGGEAWRNAAGELVIFRPFSAAGSEPQLWALALKPVDGAWRVKTLFPTSPRRRARITTTRELVRAGVGSIELAR